MSLVGNNGPVGGGGGDGGGPNGGGGQPNQPPNPPAGPQGGRARRVSSWDPNPKAAIQGWWDFTYGDRAKVLSVYRVDGRDDDTAPTDFWVNVKIGTTSDVLLVSMGLLAHLVSFMAYRPRNTSSLLTLRAKAAQKAKEIGLDGNQLSFVISGSIAVSMLVSGADERGTRAMGRFGVDITKWSERFRTGWLRDWWRRRLAVTCVSGALFVAPAVWLGWPWLVKGLGILAGWAGIVPGMLWIVAVFWLLAAGALALRPRRVVNLSRA